MTKFPGAVTCEKLDLTIPPEFTVTIHLKGKPPLHQQANAAQFSTFKRTTRENRKQDSLHYFSRGFYGTVRKNVKVWAKILFLAKAAL